MKKLLLSFLFLLSVSSVFAANEYETDINLLSFGYCDQFSGDTVSGAKMPTSQQLFLKPGESKDVCIAFANSSKKPFAIVYGFVTSHSDKEFGQICNADISTGNDFSRFFPSGDQKNLRTLLVQPNSVSQIRETMKVPLGMSGTIYGCVSFGPTTSLAANAGGMFDILVRKAAPLNAFVGGESTISNYFSLSYKGYSIAPDLSLVLSFDVANEGNIDQAFSLSGTVSNMLGYSKGFSFSSEKLLPGERKIVDVAVGMVPSYKGLFSLQYSFSSNPLFPFEIPGLDPNLLKGKFGESSLSIFLFSWIWIIVPVVLILILLKLFWPRRVKIVTVAATPPTSSI